LQQIIINEIIDIGANIGNHSIFFAKFLDCKIVHSFEPVLSNFELLKKNMFCVNNKSILYNIALSNKIDTMDLYNSQINNKGGFSLHKYNNSFLVESKINVNTLDSFNLNNITLIKIDVENHENEVLEGSKETIKRCKPIIFIENLYHGFPNICTNPNPHEKIFNELGYKRIKTNILNGYMDLWIPI